MISRTQAGGELPGTKVAKQSLLRRWRRRILGLVVGVGLACLLSEMIVLLVWGTQVRFPRRVVEAPWGIRYNEPGAQYGHVSPDVDIRFRINGQGMRSDEDFAYAKPDGCRRIVFVGDSFTIGYEVENEETFAQLTGAGLRARGMPCQILNCGVSGFGNAEQLVYLERELFKYDPDAVVLSFFINDLDDNVRSDLFRLDGERLVKNAERYVPLGAVGNFVNTNPVFGFLAEHSNAFAFFKEKITVVLKRDIVNQNLDNIRSAADGVAPSAEDGSGQSAYQGKLAAAILRRVRELCEERGVVLVLQSIPIVKGDESGMVDVFPYGEFDVKPLGSRFIRCEEFLTPLVGKELLYFKRSHMHWTPLSHRLDAEKLVAVLGEALR